MNQQKKTAFHRDFIIMVVGQIASLFGNSILRFALSLYVLDQTGSAVMFGSILAVSMIPMVVCSPFGGILADRVSRKWIMVVLDYTTTALLLLFLFLMGRTEGIAEVAVLMVLLMAIQAFYQPSVQSSIPSLVEGEVLAQANGIVIQVNALANLLGPIIGGALYGFFGLRTIVICGCACFFLSATMELFLHIPFTPQEKRGSLLTSIKGDLTDSFRFLSHENPGVLKLLFLIAALNLFFSAMFTVGLPYLVKVFLGLSSQLYGFVEAAMGVGAILGGLLSGAAAKRWKLSQSAGFLYGACVCTLPIVLSVVSPGLPMASYAAILVSILLCFCCTTLFSVIAQTFAQQMTPNHMLGKVMALVSMLSTCAFPIGQALYGFLFDVLKTQVWVVVLFAITAGVVISSVASKVLKRLPVLPEPAAAPAAEA